MLLLTFNGSPSTNLSLPERGGKRKTGATRGAERLGYKSLAFEAGFRKTDAASRTRVTALSPN
jgi:hypothetical protein